MTILNRILESKRAEVALKKTERPVASLEFRSDTRGFLSAVRCGESIALIAEVKRASPSRGTIVETFDPVRIAAQYFEGGAACLSVLTDEPFFGGSDADLVDVRSAVQLPVLRKDFIVDEYQLHESRHLGADCVLLIVAALDKSQLHDYLALSRELGMDALVEVHDEREMECALEAGSELIGINNRDLRTFETSLETTLRLAPLAQGHTTLVSESAIWTNDDAELVAGAGVKAVLVGESLETKNDIADAVRTLLRRPERGEQ
jgi:indole-3-glycerol phosphate synthase